MSQLVDNKHAFNPFDSKSMANTRQTLNSLHERKSNKTQVFSGISRCVATIRPLRELCVDKLLKQLHKVVITEDTDYQLIRPLLEKCSAIELQRLETLFSSLASKTDQLWHELCRNEFHFTTSCGPNEDKHEYIDCVPNKTSAESWRHFYWRSMDYRKRKLEEITSNIRHKSDSVKTSRKLIKVCDLEPIVEPVPKKVEPIVRKKIPQRGPLMKKCLQMKKQKFML